MTPEIEQALKRLLAGSDVPAASMEQAVGAFMDGGCSPVEIAALLTALRMKGESVEELVGAARAMRQRATPITPRSTGLLDTCGTGGDALHTFNISTATALVAAAAGVPVAKHGNRSVSSSSGSADVLEALGVCVQLDPQQVARCIDEVGIGFCFAPLFHGAMRHVAPVRRELGFRTIFNLLGPLTNPAGAEYQLLGVARDAEAEKIAEALAQLGARRALVVCGNGELDEVSLWGVTRVWLVESGDVQRRQWRAANFGVPECDVQALRVHSAAESVQVIRSVLDGQPGPARDIVVANTAAALIAANRAEQSDEAARQAAAVLDSGAARQLCEQLVAWTSEVSS